EHNLNLSLLDKDFLGLGGASDNALDDFLTEYTERFNSCDRPVVKRGQPRGERKNRKKADTNDRKKPAVATPAKRPQQQIVCQVKPNVTINSTATNGGGPFAHINRVRLNNTR